MSRIFSDLFRMGQAQWELVLQKFSLCLTLGNIVAPLDTHMSLMNLFKCGQSKINLLS